MKIGTVKAGWKKKAAGLLAFLMMLASVLTVPFGFVFPASAAAADLTFSSGAVLITSEHDGKNILIQNGVFSVTVSGAKNVTLIFDSVTMDRRYGSDSAVTDSGIYTVASTLGWNSGSTYYAPTCPLLITNNSEVSVAFRGVNNFYAGTNRCTVTSAGRYTPVQSGMGYAGVQVDSGSTLTIEQSNGTLNAYGAYYVEGDNSENSTYGYGEPSGISHNVTGGGAGIGGGADWNNVAANSKTYTAGTPGTIIINGGTVNAYGGHQAAGIGGAVNSAATSSSITINGGTVTAKGGRWAAGIGDGDSLENSYSNTYNNDYSINITGGTVTAVGGVACSGIGATDNISGGTNITPSVSGMNIRITGGTIDACSGYPDKFSPSSTTAYTGTDAAAAVGAGNNTRMEAQSIYISSGVNMIASSFGHYAITENGVEHNKVPQVSIEQGRMYNGRFPNLTSTADRTFRLLEAQREDILVNGKVGNYIKFITQPTDGSEGTVYYYDSDEFVLLNADKSVYPLPDDFEERRTQLLKFFEENNMTLYADENSVETGRVVARKNFKSIALTLPDPAEHGGVYALEIPTSQLVSAPDGVTLPKSEKIHITITALTAGNIWGEIDYPFSYNMKLDAVSASFANLDVYPAADWAGRDDGLIGEKFSESLFAYTVYIENNATETYLYALFVMEDGVSYTIKLDNEVQTVQTRTEVRGDVETKLGYVLIRVSMEGVTQKVLQLEKQDTNDEVTAHSIIYKVTINRKAVYSISLKDLSKVYDGKAVDPAIVAVRTGTGATASDVTVTDEELKSATFTYGKGTTTGLTDVPKDAGTYTVTATIRAETYTATGSAAFTISKKKLTVSRIEKYLMYVRASEYETWKDQETYPITDAGAVFVNGLVSGESVVLSYDSVFYNDLSVGYGSEKITLTGVKLSGDAARNYTVDSEQTVFGQINYSLDGAIFRKEEGDDKAWDKFYPIDSTTPVGSGTTPDYHSPANADGTYTSHRDYVYARTQGGGAAQAVYAVEVEFGAMYFNYTKEVWNTTSMKYEQAEDGQSFWIGFDGVNNRVSVINRSNADIGCNVTPSIKFIYASHDGGQSGIVASVYTVNRADATYLVTESMTVTVDKATPPESVTGKGTPTRQDFFLILSGNPQSGNTENYIAVGDMTVTITKSSG